MLYDKPVRLLLADCVEAIGPTFSPNDAVLWFNTHYPLVDDKTVTAHVRAFCVNDRNRRHYSFARHRPGFLYRNGRGSVTIYEPELHGEFNLDGTPVVDFLEDDHGGSLEDFEERSGNGDLTPADAEFALEVYLEEFLLTNWSRIPWGAPLALFENGRGHQLPTSVGRLDFLAVDATDDGLVVIELKRGRPADQVVGQVLRYMGWVKHNLAGDRSVRGLVIAAEIDERLKYAASMVPGLELMSYALTFDLRAERLNG